MTVSLGVKLFDIAFWIYVVSTVLYIRNMVKSTKAMGQAATAALILGLVFHTASLVVRTAAAQRPPFLNLYEYVLSLTWGAVIVYLAIEFIAKNKSIGAFAMILITFFTFLGVRLPSEVNPTMPALRSAWRVPHIFTGILAYSAFGLAFAFAIMYLIVEKKAKQPKSFWVSRLPASKDLDQLIYRTLAFGFVMQTALLITGAIWAQWAWGRYWGWDPKETWALITWLIYAAYLHMRTTKGWRGRASAIFCIVGFVATIFTLFGVSYLLSGLHSYAG